MQTVLVEKEVVIEATEAPKAEESTAAPAEEKPAEAVEAVPTAPAPTAAPEPTQAPEPTAAPTAEKPTQPPEPTASPAPPTEAKPTEEPPAATMPAVTAQPSQPSQPQSELEEIDKLLAQTMPANIAYNTPRSMLLDETREVQLLLSPSLSKEALSQRVTPSGQVVSAGINVTSRMQAELKPEDPEAFAIQPLHADAVQLVSNAEPTEWKWSISARKEGQHQLHLTLYRLVEYDGKEYWRKVKEYEDTLQVDVTLGQRLSRLDWYWVVGILLTGLLLPALWFWLGRRKSRT